MRKQVLFVMMLFFCMFVVSGLETEEFIDDVVLKVNSNSTYLSFVSDLGYSSVGLDVSDDVYFFELNDSVKVVNESDVDFVVRMDSEDFSDVMSFYESNDVGGLAEVFFDVVPFRVKLNTFFSCMKSGWCRGLVF